VEGDGFELVWGFCCQVLVFGLLRVLCSEQEGRSSPVWFAARLPALASFEAWSDLVRSALVWLGKPDPVSTIEALRTADPAREARARVLGAWVQLLGSGNSYPVGEVIRLVGGDGKAEQAPQLLGSEGPAEEPPERRELREALLAVAADYNAPQKVNPKRLGKWLQGREKTISGKHKLFAGGTAHASPSERKPAFLAVIAASVFRPYIFFDMRRFFPLAAANER
jgi:hypothetical protein